METGVTFEAIVLAAGSGVRFGGGKLLATYQGAPLLHAALAAARAAPVRSVSVVTGADAEGVGAAVRAFDPDLRLVHAADHAEGMAASLRAGVRSLPADTDAVFLFLGDMPRVPHAVLAPLALAVRNGAPAAAPEYEGRRGHPVVLTRKLFARIAALTGDTGARPLLSALGQRLAIVQAPDDGVLFDIDAPADLIRLRP